MTVKKYYPHLLAGLGAGLTIGLLAFFDTLQSDYLLLMAPFGASTVLVFGVPDSPLAQPKNVIFGHVLTAFIGLCFLHFVGVTPLTMGVATGLGVSAMLLTGTTHPPAGANPVLIMLTAPSWSFIVTPVLAGAIFVVLIGKIFKSLRQKLPA